MHNGRQLFLVLGAGDLLLAVGALLFFDTKVLWNTQIGFLSASLIMVASMLSYRRMVNTRVAHNIITLDDSKDVIDKLEDPYDLYSETVLDEEKGGSEERAFSEVVKEEKNRLKESKRTLFQVLKDTKAALSLYRLGAYGFLILGFLYLNRHALLHIPSYIVALSLPPLLVVVVLLRSKAEQTE